MNQFLQGQPLRYFLDSAHRSDYDQMARVGASGQYVIGPEIRKQLSSSCPVTVYLYYRENPEHFTLTHLRILRERLTDLGATSLYLSVSKDIAVRSNTPEDWAQYRSQALPVRSPRCAESLDLQLPEGYFPRKGTILLAFERAGFQTASDDIERAVERLHASGYGVHVVLAGPSVSKVPNSWVASAPITQLSLPAYKCEVGLDNERLFANKLLSLCVNVKPAALQSALGSNGSWLVAQVARILEVPFVWDYEPRCLPFMPSEPALERSSYLCRDHTEASRQISNGEANLEKFAALTWVRTLEDLNELSPNARGRVLMHPSEMVNAPWDPACEFIIDSSQTSVSSMIRLLRTIYTGPSESPFSRIVLVGQAADYARRVSRGLPKNVHVEAVASWGEVAGGPDRPRPGVALLVQPLDGIPEARATLRLAKKLLGKGLFLMLPESMRLESLSRSVAQSSYVYLDGDLGLLVNSPNGEKRLGDTGLSVTVPQHLTQQYASIGIAPRLSATHDQVTGAYDYEISEQEFLLWSEWFLSNSSPDISNWFNGNYQDPDAIILDGWTYATLKPIPLSADMNWTTVAPKRRSQRFMLHTWEFMDPVIQEFLKTNELLYLEWCLDIATSWIEQNFLTDAPPTMPWSDKSLALRAPRLAGLIHLAVANNVSRDRLLPLFRLALAHQNAHVANESSNPKNNSGFYRALGQLFLGRELAVLPGMEGSRTKGELRLRQIVEQQFFPDGGHSEHSPEYHRICLTPFQQAVDQRIITDPFVVDRVNVASHVLGWLVQPSGKLLQFGDSPSRNMLGVHESALHPETRFILSDGRRGRPSQNELLPLYESGYAIVRSPQPQNKRELRQSSYLAVQAGFHSRAHKHCDDGTLVWSEQDVEILVDGGRFSYGAKLPMDSPLRREGFYYQSLERQYVESVVAHNVVTLDGKNHQRRRRPYGSGLIETSHKNDSFDIGTSFPQAGWNWQRNITFNPGVGLTLEDVIQVQDDDHHECVMYFNFGPNIQLFNSASGRPLNEDGSTPLWIRLDDNPSKHSVAKGQYSPMRGWRSTLDRQVEPILNYERRILFEKELHLTTTFSLNRLR